MVSIRICAFLAVWAGCYSPPSLAQDTKLDPTQPYRAHRLNPIVYKIEFKAIVTAPQGTQKLRVWIPIPQNDLGQEISEHDWHVFPDPIKPTFHREEMFGNHFAYFEFQNPQGAQIITHRFQAKVWELHWNVDQAKVLPVKTWPKAFQPYQRSERAIVVDDEFKKWAEELVRDKSNALKSLNEIIDWTQDNLHYDHSTTSLIASAKHAKTYKRGDCSDYHGLCASLGRALGVPTRVTYGYHLFPKNLPSHCKLEAFLPPYGWVSFDVSETQKLTKAVEADASLTTALKKELKQRAQQRLMKGFRDNTWLLHSKGTDYELAPKASQKVPLISTIYAEADGKPFPLPDPADPKQKTFSWMTAHRYQADRPVIYPFRTWQSLLKK